MTVTNQGSFNIKVPQGYLEFGGADGQDFVLLNEDIQLISAQSFTVCSWMKWNVHEDAVDWMGADDQYQRGRFEIMTSSSFKVWTSGNNQYDMTMSTYLPEDKWFHLCITRDDSDTVDLYLNGTSIATAASVKGFIPIRRIGAEPENSQHAAWDGGMHDIQIWNNSGLSATEVKRVYNGIDEGPTHVFRFNEREDSIVYNQDESISGSFISSIAWDDRVIRCWNTRWDEGDWDVTISTFLDACDRNYLFNMVTPGAVRELWNILGSPKFIDSTYTSSNSLIVEPLGGYGIDDLRESRTIAVKSISDDFINREYYSIKIDGTRTDTG